MYYRRLLPFRIWHWFQPVSYPSEMSLVPKLLKHKESKLFFLSQQINIFLQIVFCLSSENVWLLPSCCMTEMTQKLCWKHIKRKLKHGRKKSHYMIVAMQLQNIWRWCQKWLFSICVTRLHRVCVCVCFPVCILWTWQYFFPFQISWFILRIFNHKMK